MYKKTKNRTKRNASETQAVGKFPITFPDRKTLLSNNIMLFETDELSLLYFYLSLCSARHRFPKTALGTNVLFFISFHLWCWMQTENVRWNIAGNWGNAQGCEIYCSAGKITEFSSRTLFRFTHVVRKWHRNPTGSMQQKYSKTTVLMRLGRTLWKLMRRERLRKIPMRNCWLPWHQMR